MEIVGKILSYIGAALLSLGAVTTVAYWIFRQFASKWLQSKFDKQLESFRGEQQRELERLRAKINREFDRARKLHEREFVVLPEAWAQFVLASDQVRNFTHPFQQYPNLGSISNTQLEEFFEESPLSGTEKDEIRNSVDRTKRYIKIIFFHRYADTMKAMQNFNRYFRINGVFIQPEVSEKLQRLLDIMHRTVIEHHMNETENLRPRLLEASNTMKEEGGPLFEEIKRDVQARLWDSQSERCREN